MEKTAEVEKENDNPDEPKSSPLTMIDVAPFVPERRATITSEVRNTLISTLAYKFNDRSHHALATWLWRTNRME